MSRSALQAELDRWAECRARATFWWRDDDATEASPALARLVDAANAWGVPVAVAVIPQLMRDDLAAALLPARSCTVLLHGFAHRNHAPPGERRAELGVHRPTEVCITELRSGAARLRDAFDGRFASVLVPPWNRIDAGVVARLPEVPLAGLSTFAPRRERHAAPGVVQVNTHVDPIDWRGARTFVGEDETAARLVQHLAARRNGSVDGEEPTGLLTHHRVFDESAWRVIGRLLDVTSRHPAAAWLAAASVFAPATCARSA